VLAGDDFAGFQEVFDKLLRYSEALEAIEGWLDGRDPQGLALRLGPRDFADFRRSPLRLGSLDALIARDSTH
jgi:hypothetical protein